VDGSCRHVTLLLILHVLCLTAVGGVVVKLLLGHWRRGVRCVFHYADVSVCCFLSATLVPNRLPKGSTDVLVVVNQVSCGNRDEVDVLSDVSMSLVGAVITGVLLWIVVVVVVVCTVLDQGWPWCLGDWWWSTFDGNPDV
jgi:hypothetical protein